MIDITREEIWESEDIEIEKNESSRVKKFITKHKIVTILLVSLGALMTINTILIYNFLKILTSM